MHLAWSHKTYMHFFASYGATTGVISIRSFSSFCRSSSSNLGDWEFWLLFFQPWFELWKWQRDFFDKWCNTTAVQTLQWLINFDWLLILLQLLHCLLSLVFFSILQRAKFSILAREMHNNAQKSDNNTSHLQKRSLNFIWLFQVIITPSVTSESTGR